MLCSSLSAKHCQAKRFKHSIFIISIPRDRVVRTESDKMRRCNAKLIPPQFTMRVYHSREILFLSRPKLLLIDTRIVDVGSRSMQEQSQA
jgi:hypothetical protein